MRNSDDRDSVHTVGKSPPAAPTVAADRSDHEHPEAEEQKAEARHPGVVDALACGLTDRMLHPRVRVGHQKRGDRHACQRGGEAQECEADKRSPAGHGRLGVHVPASVAERRTLTRVECPGRHRVAAQVRRGCHSVGGLFSDQSNGPGCGRGRFIRCWRQPGRCVCDTGFRCVVVPSLRSSWPQPRAMWRAVFAGPET